MKRKASAVDKCQKVHFLTFVVGGKRMEDWTTKTLKYTLLLETLSRELGGAEQDRSFLANAPYAYFEKMFVVLELEYPEFEIDMAEILNLFSRYKHLELKQMLEKGFEVEQLIDKLRELVQKIQVSAM